MKAFDTDGPIDLAAAKAAGAVGVGLYLGGNLTRAAAQEAAALGLALWSFAENQASDPNGGAPNGARDARQWATYAYDVGQPLGAPIFAPNDQVVTDMGATLAYFEAAAKIWLAMRRVPGFYGQASMWAAVKGFGYRYFVKAPDNTNDTLDANIVQSVSPGTQIAGVTVDVDEILTADFGGWNANGLFIAGGVVDMQVPTLVPGDKGVLVAWLIDALVALGYAQGNVAHGDPPLEIPPSPVSAVYGAAVGAAVRRFREDHLPASPGADFGQDCWAKLPPLLLALKSVGSAP